VYYEIVFPDCRVNRLQLTKLPSTCSKTLNECIGDLSLFENLDLLLAAKCREARLNEAAGAAAAAFVAGIEMSR
jgi:hypothetical protein